MMVRTQLDWLQHYCSGTLCLGNLVFENCTIHISLGFNTSACVAAFQRVGLGVPDFFICLSLTVAVSSHLRLRLLFNGFLLSYRPLWYKNSLSFLRVCILEHFVIFASPNILHTSEDISFLNFTLSMPFAASTNCDTQVSTFVQTLHISMYHLTAL